MSVLDPQPDPVGDGDVWAEILADEPPGPMRDLMAERRQQGIERYGRPLGRTNGRDHNADAVQEAIDGIAYARADRDKEGERLFRLTLTHLVRRHLNGHTPIFKGKQ